MHNLAPLCPLGGDTPRSLSHGGMTLSESVDTALASVTARAGTEHSVATVLNSYLGTALPEPGQVSFGETLSAFWIGPQQHSPQLQPNHYRLGPRPMLADSASTEIYTRWC